VQKIESVTFSSGNTNFIIVARPLCSLVARRGSVRYGPAATGMPYVPAGAALFALSRASGGFSTCTAEVTVANF
jgi:hypothetical protein